VDVAANIARIFFEPRHGRIGRALKQIPLAVHDPPQDFI
jgi:hypothetical protein